MNFLSQLGAPVPLAALVADPLFATSSDGTSGTRTVVGALAVLVVMGVVLAIGLWMGRDARS